MIGAQARVQIGLCATGTSDELTLGGENLYMLKLAQSNVFVPERRVVVLIDQLCNVSEHLAQCGTA